MVVRGQEVLWPLRRRRLVRIVAGITIKRFNNRNPLRSTSFYATVIHPSKGKNVRQSSCSTFNPFTSPCSSSFNNNDGVRRSPYRSTDSSRLHCARVWDFIRCILFRFSLCPPSLCYYAGHAPHIGCGDGAQAGGEGAENWMGTAG